MISFLKRSQKTRVSIATSREGGEAVGITLAGCVGRTDKRSFLCHAMLSRASGTRKRHGLDQASQGDTIPAMNAFWNSFETLLGLSVEPRNLTFIQISLRGVIIFLATLAMVRLGHKRSLSHKTPFDAVLLVILASVLSRAINGSAAFFATIGGGVVLVLLHRFLAYLAFYSHAFGILVKGRPDIIVRDGQYDFGDAAQPYLQARLGRGHAPGRESRRFVQSSRCPSRTQRGHQFYQKIICPNCPYAL